MAYCARTDVEMKTRRWMPTGFTTTTKPKAADVEQFVTDIAAEIDAILAADGITVPVTNATAVAYLKHLNVLGAAALTADVLFPQATGEGETPAGAKFEKRYQDGLARLESGDNPVALILSQAADTGGRAPISHYTEMSSSDQELTEPHFTRDMEF